mgnify:CR=1 FL=1
MSLTTTVRATMPDVTCTAGSPPPCTNWTRLVLPPVLIGHAAPLRFRAGPGAAPLRNAADRRRPPVCDRAAPPAPGGRGARRALQAALEERRSVRGRRERGRRERGRRERVSALTRGGAAQPYASAGAEVNVPVEAITDDALNKMVRGTLVPCRPAALVRRRPRRVRCPDNLLDPTSRGVLILWLRDATGEGGSARADRGARRGARRGSCSLRPARRQSSHQSTCRSNHAPAPAPPQPRLSPAPRRAAPPRALRRRADAGHVQASLLLGLSTRQAPSIGPARRRPLAPRLRARAACARCSCERPSTARLCR